MARAALMVMSPDWSAKFEPVPYAKLGDPKLYMEGEHKVPAIALCIASLRARMG